MKFITALVLIFTITAHARLGETIDQCKKRYGPSQGTAQKLYFIFKGKLKVHCWFNEKGICYRISYLPVPGKTKTVPALDILKVQGIDPSKLNHVGTPPVYLWSKYMIKFEDKYLTMWDAAEVNRLEKKPEFKKKEKIDVDGL